jgi:hypothetical protein
VFANILASVGKMLAKKCHKFLKIDIKKEGPSQPLLAEKKCQYEISLTYFHWKAKLLSFPMV